MLIRHKTNIKNIAAFASVLLLSILTFHAAAIDNNEKAFFKVLTSGTDTTIDPKNSDTTVTDSSKIISLSDSASDSSRTIQTIDTLEISKDSLDAPIEYSAEDSGVLIIPTKQFMLYGKAKAKNADINLDANTIAYDQATQVVTAYGGTDTSKGVLNKPKLVQGENTSISDTIKFNLKTQRGLTKNTYYNEGEMYVHADRFKKISSSVGFGYRSTFTTCNLDTPHFAFRARKIKIVNNKIAVTGPVHPEFEGVPIPIVLPFGLFPLNRGRHSGILPPQFTSSDDFGLGLEGLGYYKVLNDNWDVTVRGNLYSYGGWSVNITPDYYKRYKYKGSLNLAIQKTKLLNSSGTAKDEFTTNNSFFITWSHSSDSRARPGTAFSASVRAGSTKYNRYVTNNSALNYQNQLSSSITWSKTWNQGKYNLSVAANHDQNNNLGLINLRLPTVNFSATTIYPFQPKELVGTPKWYQKLGISYTGTLLNQMSFYDSAFNFNKLLDTAMWGADHRIPITLTLPPLGPFTVSPSISYAERWFGQQLIRTWNPKNDTVLTQINRGFYRTQEMSFGISANTRLFGTFNFPKSKGIMAIRHEVKPSVSLSYKPDLAGKYYRTVQIDSLGNTRQYSVFEGGVISGFSAGKFGGVTFSLDNLLEMKVHDKKDTSADAPPKKVRLIDGLGFSTGYNMIVDSFNWSNINISFRSTLFQKVNITGSASIDPYDRDGLGNRVNKLLWKQGKIGRFNSGSLAISTSLQSKSKDGKTEQQRIPLDETMTPDEQQAQLDYVRNNPSEFVDFDIPWSMQLSFSLTFSRTLSTSLQNYITNISSNLNVNGDFSLTPKWKIGGNTYFDFKTTRIQQLSFFITREMHCWQLAINVTPVGLYRSFNITINPKSGILRDLRINRSRFFYSQ